ncbi:hypothetical protein MGSAQ_002007 [marine sediment metagenome]|uniref:Uncharacterized protein n=1 Tax=marine sediment metagenome TaxID=412755 RepID=A0A1B6NUT7_9ZZZZ
MLSAISTLKTTKQLLKLAQTISLHHNSLSAQLTL